MSKTKFRIVKKSKEGVLLSAKKGTEPIPMSWNEFNSGYTVENDVWAVPSDELVKKMEEINEHINNAAAAFIISGGLKGEVRDLAALAQLGFEAEKIQELVGCTGAEVIQLIHHAVEMIKNPTFPKKNRKKRPSRMEGKESNRKGGKTPELSTNTILADNPALLALKEKFNTEK